MSSWGFPGPFKGFYPSEPCFLRASVPSCCCGVSTHFSAPPTNSPFGTMAQTGVPCRGGPCPVRLASCGAWMSRWSGARRWTWCSKIRPRANNLDGNREPSAPRPGIWHFQRRVNCDGWRETAVVGADARPGVRVTKVIRYALRFLASLSAPNTKENKHVQRQCHHWRVRS